MAKLVKQNHPALHHIAEEVSISDITSPHIQKIIHDMYTVLNNYAVEGFNGVAIAAPQIGVSLRIFVVHNTDPQDTKKIIPDLVAINPRILKSSKQQHIVGEGCLSVGEQYGTIQRAKNVTLQAYDKNGKLYERGAGGILAQIFQHEIDHLDGILFIDKAEKVWHKDDMHAQHITEAQESK
jgi:peptide deformylase